MYETPLGFLRDQSAPGTALLAVALAKYGLECFEWEPEILRKEIDEDFGVQLTDLQADKLQAAILIYTSDLFETNWQVFNVCVHLLNGEYADFETFEPLEAEYIAAVLPEIEYLRNDEDGITFSDEVNAYAGLIFSQYGCSKPPVIFPSAIMPQGLADGDMTDKNEALSELYKAKKEHFENYIKRVETAYTV